MAEVQRIPTTPAPGPIPVGQSTPITVIRGDAPAGPPGPPGPPGDPAREFVQATPAASWLITHNLGRFPDVVVIVDDAEVDADVLYPDPNHLVIVHGSPLAGRAVYR